MKISTYSDSLNKVISVTDIIDGLTENVTQLREQKVSAVKLRKFLGQRKGSNQIQGITSIIRNRSGSAPLSLFIKSYKNINENVGFLADYISENFPNNITTRTASVKQLNIVGLAEASENIKNFNYTYMIEYLKSTRLGSEDYNAAIGPLIRDMRRNSEGYAWSIKNLSQQPKAFANMINGLSESVITPRSEQSAVASGVTRSTPIALAQTGFINNPIYHLGLYIMSWRANTYKLIDEERQQLERMLMMAQAEANGDTSPALKNRIERLGARIAEKRLQLIEIKEEAEYA